MQLMGQVVDTSLLYLLCVEIKKTGCDMHTSSQEFGIMAEADTPVLCWCVGEWLITVVQTKISHVIPILFQPFLRVALG